MKRRDFLKSSASVAGVLLPGIAASQARPCPPPSIGVSGGSSAASACGSDEVADWVARSTGPGVVWAHNFEHENEVLNFLIAPEIGNDPTRDWEKTHHPMDVWHEANGGLAGGGCLVVQVPAADVAFERSFGQYDASVYTTGGWYGQLRDAFKVDRPGVPFGRGVWRRPYSPLLTSGGDRRTGSGRGISDPASSETIPLKTWRPWKTEASSEQLARRMCSDFKQGVYAHPESPLPSGWVREGNEFYLQYRMKVPLKRFFSERMLPAYTGEPGSRFFTNTSPRRARQAAQKYLWLANLTDGVQAQELVVSGYPQLRVVDGSPYDTKETAFLILYTAFGPEIFRSQGGSWEVPKDIWVTYLHRVRWGRPQQAETVVEWYASVNGSSYVTLGSASNVTLQYALNTPFGGNCFEPTHYNNATDNMSSVGVANARNPAYNFNAGAAAFAQDTYQNRFTQIIFSTKPIPAPSS